MAKRGGQPSTTTPMPGPWDSPQVEIRKSSPKVLATVVSQATTAAREDPRPLSVPSESSALSSPSAFFSGICRGFSSTYAHEHDERIAAKVDNRGFRGNLRYQVLVER